MSDWEVREGDTLHLSSALPPKSVNCIVTSPPYLGLRNYNLPPTEWPEVAYAPMAGLPHVIVPAQSCCIGAESDPLAFVGHIVLIWRNLWNTLYEDGTCWLNLGDSYAGSQSNNGGYGDKSTLSGFTRPDTKGRISYRATVSHKTEYRLKDKNLLVIPWRIALALQADGWYLRTDIVWAKPNSMPESITDRPTRSHEFIFLLSKTPKYYYDAAAISEESRAYNVEKITEKTGMDLGEDSTTTKSMTDTRRTDKQRGHSRRHAGFNDRWDAMSREEQCSGMRNKRDVWTVPTSGFPGAHFATYPPDLIRPCIRAGCPVGGVCLDPFSGSGTTGQVCVEEGRSYIGFEMNPEYAAMSRVRIGNAQPTLFGKGID